MTRLIPMPESEMRAVLQALEDIITQVKYYEQGTAAIATLRGRLEEPVQPKSEVGHSVAAASQASTAPPSEHTIVVRFPEGVSPRYHFGMEALGGTVVAVDFGGNRLEVAEVLQEALEDCLRFLENDADWMEDAEPERQAARAAIAKANEVKP